MIELINEQNVKIVILSIILWYMYEIEQTPHILSITGYCSDDFIIWYMCRSKQTPCKYSHLIYHIASIKICGSQDFMLSKEKQSFMKFCCLCWNIIWYFPIWLQNRFISVKLEPVLSHTEKSCIALYYRQFSTNIK